MFGDMTIFDARGNFNLIYVDDSFSNVYARTAGLNELDMSRYNSIYGQGTNRLLDWLPVYADSPNDYYDIMFHCVSPGGLYSFENTKEQMWDMRVAKSRFFAEVRGRQSISMPNHISSNGFALSDVTAAINPGSLALLSIPAYMVLSLSNFVTIDQAQTVGRGVYQTMAPPRLQNLEDGSFEIYDFNDYLDAFHYGNFLSNDSDLFLTVFGLAHSIALFKWQIENSQLLEAGSIEKIIGWEPFTWTWNKLIEIGALRDPFKSKPTMFNISRFGAENGDELNPNLHAALKLTDLLCPLFASAGEPWAKLSVFYGLIDVFPLRNYFGIDYGKEIKFAS